VGGDTGKRALEVGAVRGGNPSRGTNVSVDRGQIPGLPTVGWADLRPLAGRIVNKNLSHLL
jgi:hypothetical protein